MPWKVLLFAWICEIRWKSMYSENGLSPTVSENVPSTNEKDHWLMWIEIQLSYFISFIAWLLLCLFCNNLEFKCIWASAPPANGHDLTFAFQNSIGAVYYIFIFFIYQFLRNQIKSVWYVSEAHFTPLIQSAYKRPIKIMQNSKAYK